MTFGTKLLLAAAVAWLPFLAAPAAAQRSNPLREDRCDVQAQRAYQVETVAVPSLHVLDQTGQADRFAPVLPSGAQAIVCLRTSIMPQAHDDEVIALGVPLVLAETGGQHRLGILEAREGRYRYRMMEGRLTPEEESTIQARLEEYHSRLPGRHS